MEQEGQQFLAKVADAYLKIAEEHPERFVVVDADREPAAVFDSVREALERAVHERDDHPGELGRIDDRPAVAVPVSFIPAMAPGPEEVDHATRASGSFVRARR